MHDYASPGGVVHAKNLAPAGAPAWVSDRSESWNRVEETEGCNDAQLRRALIVSLPHDLNDRTRHAMVPRFVHKQFAEQGW